MVASVAQEPHTSKSLAALILLVFLCMSVVCLWLPISGFWGMVSDFQSHQPVVIINKGVYYLLGIGIAMMALLIDGFNNGVLRRKLSLRLAKFINRSALSGMVVMLLLPALVHYPMAGALEKDGYVTCPDRSSQWLFVRTIVYALPDQCHFGE